MATWIGATLDYNNASNWSGGIPDAPGETAIFGAAGSPLVNSNAAVNPDSWTFSSTAQKYFIGGSPVTLNTALVNNAAVSEHVQNSIAGSGSLLQDGSGTLILEGENTYTGGTTINSGTLRIGFGSNTG